MSTQGIDIFETTHWSLVLAAGRSSSPASTAALTSLCETYWYPLYAYVRRRVDTVDEARDLTQEFFANFIEKRYFATARPERGRFRAFLLTTFKHFLANEWDKARALKRGGGSSPISLDFDKGESRFHLEPQDDLTPERLYDRQWALTLLKRVLDTLRDEFVRDGKQQQFDHLKQFVSGRPPAGGYAEAAAGLGMSEGAAKVAAHRLRRLYRKLLREEISQTVSTPGEVDDEIRNLFTVFST